MKFGFLCFLLSAGVSLAKDNVVLTPFLKEYCVECHSGDTTKGGLDFDTLSGNLFDEDVRRRWVFLYDRVAHGEMPPEKKKQPDAAVLSDFLAKLGESLAAADLSTSEVVLRRLNRNEYENTVRDLFGIHFDAKRVLPGEEKEQGFDTIGSDHSISAQQMVAYLEAADLVLDEVFGSRKPPETYHGKLRFSEFREKDRADRLTGEGGIMFGSRPVPLWNISMPSAGRYRFRLRARAVQSESPLVLQVNVGVTGNIEPHLAGFFEVPPGDFSTIEFTDQAWENGDSMSFSFPAGWPSWDHVGEDYRGPGILVEGVEVEGPLEAWPPPSRRRLLGDINPARGTLHDIRSLLSGLLPRAFRRSTTDQELERFTALAGKALKKDRSFEGALRRGLKGVLCAPEFLFLVEPEEIDNYAIATRLSYFLWSSMPDNELLELADQGELSRPEVLQGQIERLLNDEKAERFVENFTGQWLRLRDIDFTEPDRDRYPEYSELLRHSMIGETRGFFREILTHDLSVRNFIDSDFVMINEPLARFYGIDGVKGLEIRRVPLPDDSVRGGVLTQASVLKVSADGTRTSPVLRGAWILKHFYGTPSPPPPQTVAAVEPDIRGATTIREQIAKHRDHQSCNRCHCRIDPPGFALESFDVIGARRDWYRSHQGDFVDRTLHPLSDLYVQYKRGQKVDPSGVLSDGRSFSGIQGYKRFLLEDDTEMARSMTRLLLSYSLGRKIGFSDRSELDGIVSRLKDKNYGLRSMIHEIVKSDAFLRP